MSKTLLIDLKKCTGCELCVDHCSSSKTGFYSQEHSRIRILRDETKGVFVPLVCVQCQEHPCVDACPVEAIKYEHGLALFTVDKDLCTACGECVEVCPYEGIFLNAGTALKCDLCRGDPACARVCYPEALQYLEADESQVVAALEEKTRELNRNVRK